MRGEERWLITHLLSCQPLDYACTVIGLLAAAVCGYCQVHLIIGNPLPPSSSNLARSTHDVMTHESVWGDALDVASAKGSDLRDENEKNFLFFVYVGLISGACAWVYTSLFKITGYRQGAYWRKAYLVRRGGLAGALYTSRRSFLLPACCLPA